MVKALTFRDLGQDEYESYVQHTFVKKSSTNKVTVKHQKLKNFTKPKVTKQRLQSLEHDKKKVSMCLKRKLEAADQGQPQPRSEQYLELPMALCDGNGMPNRGNKSIARDRIAIP